MSRKAAVTKAVAMLSVIGLTAAPGLSQAAGVDFYAGADVVQLSSELDTNTGVPQLFVFTTQHLRLKGGMNVTRWLAVEAQLLSSADDTDRDNVGDLYQNDTGVIAGIFAKPHVTFGPVDLYGLLGYATADATFDCSPSCPPKWKASLDGFAYGLGAQYLVTQKLKVSLDLTVYHAGSDTYDDGLTPFKSDTVVGGFGLGVNYTF